MDKKETYICCLCGEENEGFGNNPYPLCEDRDIGKLRCCDYCNMRLVIPARIAQFAYERLR